MPWIEEVSVSNVIGTLTKTYTALN